MTKTIVAAQRKRGKVVKERLVTIRDKIKKLLDECDGENITNDAENICHCLECAMAEVQSAIDNYTTFI